MKLLYARKKENTTNIITHNKKHNKQTQRKHQNETPFVRTTSQHCYLDKHNNIDNHTIIVRNRSYSKTTGEDEKTPVNGQNQTQQLKKNVTVPYSNTKKYIFSPSYHNKRRTRQQIKYDSGNYNDEDHG